MARRRRGAGRGIASRRSRTPATATTSESVPSPTESEESCGSGSVPVTRMSTGTHKKFGKFRCLLMDKNEVSGSDSDMAVEVVGIVDPNQSSESEACDRTDTCEKDDVLPLSEKTDDDPCIDADDMVTVIEIVDSDKIEEDLRNMNVNENSDEFNDDPPEASYECDAVTAVDDVQYNASITEQVDEMFVNEETVSVNTTDLVAVVDACTPSDSPGSLISSTDTTNDSTISGEGESVRRSSRIRSISELKVRSRGRGLVQTKAMLKQGCSDINETSMTHGFSALPGVNGPVKVKQRWRRSSELEAAREDPEMEARLRQFIHLKENQYLAERVVSREAKRMTCDCFLTKEEIERGEYGCGEDCLNRLLMIECGCHCIVGDRCTNKRFQNLKYASCEVFRTEKKGFGIRALKDINCGEFIMEYVGEVVDQTEFEKRAEVYSDDKNRHYYFMSLRADAVIDATQKGNVSRFINHSCEPNAETQKWTVNGELRIGFFARRDIKASEEITFDYQFQRYGKEAQKCYCGTTSCRGWIGEEPDLDDEEYEEDEEENVEVNDTIKERSATPDNGIKLKDGEDRMPVQRDIKRKRGKKPTPKVSEDLDLDEEINKLSVSGIKNRAHTLTISRLFVRAHEPSLRVRLMRLLRDAEMPCRRLFLDYHGLRLLHTWMTPNESQEFKMEILETLASLPIPNKIMLLDSKVLETVQKWSIGCLTESPNTDSGSSTPDTVSTIKTDGQENTNSKEMNSKEASLNSGSVELVPLALKLLSDWSLLKEMFRIPKKERIEQMKEHEREADRVSAQVINEDTTNARDRYERYRERRDPGPRRQIPVQQSTMSKHERRQLFALQVAQEEEERRRQSDPWRMHEQRCLSMGIDPYRQPYMTWWRPPHPNGLHAGPPMPGPVGPPLPGTMAIPNGTPFTGQMGTPIPGQLTMPGSMPGHIPGPMPGPMSGPMPVQMPSQIPVQLQPQVPGQIPPPVPGISPNPLSNSISIPPPLPGTIPSIQSHPSNALRGSISASGPQPVSVTIPPPLPGTIPSGQQLGTRTPTDLPLPPLPPPVKLPPKWKCAWDKRGRPYYYHIKIRVSQWEPPEFSPGQSTVPPLPPDTLSVESDSSSSEESSTVTEESSDEDSTDEDDAEIDDTRLMLEVRQKLKLAEPDKSVEPPIKRRREALVQEIIISPRSEEDKQNSKDELRRYRETKEKLRRRKEAARAKERKAALAAAAETQFQSIDSEQEQKIKNIFRKKMANIMVQILGPYTKSDCKQGRIINTEDFKHLAKKLTMFVMLKELKKCRSVAELAVNNSVKSKAREFVRKYMAKFGDTYKRSKDEVD